MHPHSGLNFAWAEGITGNKSTDNSTPLPPVEAKNCKVVVVGSTTTAAVTLSSASPGLLFSLLSQTHTRTCRPPSPGGPAVTNHNSQKLINRSRITVSALFSMLYCAMRPIGSQPINSSRLAMRKEGLNGITIDYMGVLRRRRGIPSLYGVAVVCANASERKDAGRPALMVRRGAEAEMNLGCDSFSWLHTKDAWRARAPGKICAGQVRTAGSDIARAEESEQWPRQCWPASFQTIAQLWLTCNAAYTRLSPSPMATYMTDNARMPIPGPVGDPGPKGSIRIWTSQS
ncbi:hypothetical protein V8C42DRAFT_123193 [Trichoderma barbatum]